MKKEGRKRPKTCFGKSKENTSAAYSYERKRFQKCTPHIAVIGTKGHQAVTLRSVNVGHTIHNVHVCSRDSTLLDKHTPVGPVVARIRYLAVRTAKMDPKGA